MENKKPKANSKLQNVKAIKQMLSGTHKTQTRKTVGFSDVDTVREKTKKREIGERWVDEQGVHWEQKNGYRVKNVDRAERIESIREYLNGPKVCPECNQEMTKKLDTKYYNIHKMCMDCSIDLEHKMRLKGTWKEYERKRILENVKKWLIDAEKEKNILLKQIGNNSYINSDGTVEKWDLPYDVDVQRERIEKGFVKFKTNLLTEYGATEEELAQFEVGENKENYENPNK